jgi:predicted nucleic acid-binding protein
VITAVDTNVLLDIFGADPQFGERSAQALKRCLAEGAVAACAVVWAETAARFPDETMFLQAMRTLGIEFSGMSEAMALRAGSVWRKYRASGGKRDRVAADFLIGAYAAITCDRLLTRDRGFYRGYFSGLVIVDPVTS